MRQDRSVEEELRIRQLVSVDVEGVGHQRVPVVELAEFQRDAVPVLEVGVEEHGGIELELQQVAAQVLHVLLYHNPYGLAWKLDRRQCSSQILHSVFNVVALCV